MAATGGEPSPQLASPSTPPPENTKLQLDLVKVEELEGKITSELASLKDSISTMARVRRWGGLHCMLYTLINLKVDCMCVEISRTHAALIAAFNSTN